MLPKNLRPEVCDQTFALPPGVTEAWVRAGYLRWVWFVERGQIVRGVRVEPVRVLVNARRVAAVKRARATRATGTQLASVAGPRGDELTRAGVPLPPGDLDATAGRSA